MPSCLRRPAQSLAQQSAEFPQYFPADGWVEHDPEDIWQTTVDVTAAMVGGAIARQADRDRHHQSARNCCDLGPRHRQAIYNAIVWQDRRTADICAVMKNAGNETMVTEKTGLLLDPYFTATKFAWILKEWMAHVTAPTQAICVSAPLIAFNLRLTGGNMHVTDATNASRTSLYNIHEHNWDDELLDLFSARGGLPKVLDCASEFGTCDDTLFDSALPIRGVAGDQQAAAIGQGCLTPGALKSTFGTGCFVIINTGDEAVASKNKLLTTVGYRLGGKTTYALEGSIFVSGAIVQWLRDGLQIIGSANETETIAARQSGNNGVYMVPALTGLARRIGPNARGAIYGITRDTGPSDFVRAALNRWPIRPTTFSPRSLVTASRCPWYG